MRTSATESRNALWGHVYYFGFKSLDHSLAFCCFQIPNLNLNLGLTQTQIQTPPPRAKGFNKRLAAGPAGLSTPCCEVRKKSRQIQKISSLLPPHFLAAAESGNSYISWARLFSRERQPVCSEQPLDARAGVGHPSGFWIWAGIPALRRSYLARDA